jgi:hypothetical protein
VQRKLNLVTRYDARSNQYTVLRHDLTPEKADEAVRDLSARLFGLFVIDQDSQHSAADPEKCDGLSPRRGTDVPCSTETNAQKEARMTAQKQSDRGSSRPSTITIADTATQTARKPWKKKTPVEVVLDQINRLRDDVLAKEEELKQAKRQLQKLEEARKVLEAT